MGDVFGVTVEEFVADVTSLVQAAIEEYEDDHILTFHEIAKIIGPGTDARPGLLEHFAQQATGVYAIGFHVLVSLIKAALPLIPGAD